VPCFNVTSDDFNPPEPNDDDDDDDDDDNTVQPTGSSKPSESESPSSGGLSGGAKAGIAVAAIVGGALIFGAIAFFLFRRGRLAGIRARQAYDIRAQKLNAMNEQNAA
jgi:hypothetical protein